MRQIVVCVLGMHRSDTSCLAGCLEQAGASLGKVGQQAKHNPLGNRELADVARLNDQVLQENGGSWRLPPKDPIEWTDRAKNDRDRIVASFADEPIWGFKDPRTLLTLDGWLEALPEVRLVGTIRDPRLVARSLRARAQREFLWEQAIWIWWEYNRRLLRAWKRRPFPLVNFGLEETAYLTSVRSAARQLELPNPEAINFFELEHRHQAGETSEPLSEAVEELYATLLDRCVAP